MKNKKQLKRMLGSGVADLSSEDIRKLIEAEVSKDEDKIDAEYIDLCFELLSMKEESEKATEAVRKPQRKVLKTLVLAAVIAAILISALTVIASVLNFDIPEKIAQLDGDNAYFDLNYEFADTTADGYSLLETELAKTLAAKGVSPITVPEEIVNGNSTDFEYENLNSDSSINISICIYFKYKGMYSECLIRHFSREHDWTGYSVLRGVIQGEMIKANGLDVLVIEQKSFTTIKYKNNLTEYLIRIEGLEFEEALEFAKTIK